MHKNALKTFCFLLIHAGLLSTKVNANLSLQGSDIRLRGIFDQTNVLGKSAHESFDAFDISAQIPLPWLQYNLGDWQTGTRLMPSVGTIYTADHSAWLVSLVPLLTLSSKNARLNFDFGVGPMLMSRYQFTTQNFGGTFQFSLTAGANLEIYHGIALGYRFQHYSDGTLYGDNNVGVDFHMAELIYTFQ